MSGADVGVHIFVAGRVQGVGFRYFVVHEAERLGARGIVRNMPDRRVEVRAEGTRSSLEALVEAVQSGPTLASVLATDVRWVDATGRFDGFRVEA
jgi:acylphosphatase